MCIICRLLFPSPPSFLSVNKTFPSCRRRLLPCMMLFCLLLSLILVSGHLLTDDRTTRRPRKGDPEKTRIQSRQQRSDSSQFKVLDFFADNDQEPDSNGEFTGATLNAGFLPESFTICSALMVEAWTTEFTSASAMFRE